MKKIVLSFFITVLIVFYSHSQNKGTVVYDSYSGRTSTANPQNDNGYPYQYEVETGKLYFKNGKSLYQQKQNEMVTVIRATSDGVTKTVIPRTNRDKIGWVYLIDYNKKQIYSREAYWNFSKFESLEEELPKIVWEISKEHKKIAGYDCIKATASLYGRKWEAWFTKRIPVQFGPWKLNGLPGLILEARCKNLDFVYKVKEIKIPNNSFSDDKISEVHYFEKKFLLKSKFLSNNKEKKEKYLSYMESVAVENDGSVNIKFYPSREIHDSNQN